MQIISVSPGVFEQAISTACAVLSAGGVIVYPTETVYGLGCDATNPGAVSKLLDIKDRPAGKAISVLLADRAAAERYVRLNTTARGLYDRFLPGPLTVVSVGRDAVDPRLPAENGRLGIRLSSHPFAHELARAFAKPITATSANPAGGARPYSVQELLSRFSESQRAKIDLVLDYGTLPHAEPSTVIDSEEDVQRIVRVGATHATAKRRLQSAEETRAYAIELIGSLKHVLSEKPLIIALHGEMGAGKTELTHGIAQALGIEQPISSPSFTLVREYEHAGVTLIHADCWRTPSISLRELGLTEYLRPGVVVVIEWPEPVLAELKQLKDVVLVELMLEYTAQENERLLHLL